MEGLPKLPGLDFENRLKLNHHVAHSFDFVNGYRIPRTPSLGIGKETLNEDSIAYIPKNDSTLYDAVLTYGHVKHPPVEPFKPHFVRYDKVKLTFKAFFKQSIPESALEHYRTRFVNIMYFMDDDTMTVIEPKIENCGFPQGRLVRRSKIPKTIYGDCYYWKDLNVGIDIELFGIVYHITDCDEFAKDFLLAQGVELNDDECMPSDQVELEKKMAYRRHSIKTPSNDDKLRRYLEFQGKVLSFDCLLDESDRPNGDCLTFKMYYFLEDDTVAVKELKENQEGRDHFPMFVKRIKLPKNWKHRPASYPSGVLELTDNEVDEYYQPKDFRIGNTIYIFGRRFLLLDCDPFTRQYYADVLKDPQKGKLQIEFPKRPQPKRTQPDYLGFGTPEDSMASCMTLNPKPPKKDMIRYLLNANKYLRFGCVLDTAHPEDKIRHFILKYSLADETISINEPPIRNSGIQGGKFLSAQLVKKPDCDFNAPEYYTAKDFYIGATLNMLSHRFKIISADLYVYRYMTENAEIFSHDAIDGVRKYLMQCGHLKDDSKDNIPRECEQNQFESKPTPDLIDSLILKYSLADETISINEPPIRNSGIQGGKFLSAQLVKKPDCDFNAPEYYTAKDFYIGATLNMLSHRFKIISADLYVYRYMTENAEIFSHDAIDGVRKYLMQCGHLKDDSKDNIPRECEQNQFESKPTPDLIDSLENIHYFPDEATKVFDEPFTVDSAQCESPYKIVRSEAVNQTINKNPTSHQQMMKDKKNVHFAEYGRNDE